MQLNKEKNLIDLIGMQMQGNMDISENILKLRYSAILQLKISEGTVHIALLLVGLKKKVSNMKCLFFFKDIKQHFTSVKSVRKFLKGKQVWKCILGHTQVKINQTKPQNM